MIKNFYRVTLSSNGEERVVLETDNEKLAKQKDAEIEMAESLLVETERLITSNAIDLPEGVKVDAIEPFLEQLFLSFASNKSGMKRALKGATYHLPDPSTDQ